WERTRGAPVMRAESLAAGRRGRHTVVGRFEGDDGMLSKMAGGSAVARIQDLILAEGLAPGDPMPTEGALCEQLGISRSSVREAMRTLASLDIVEVRHGHGTFVGQLSLSPLVDGLLFRARLNDGNDLRALREVVEVRIALDLSVAEQLVGHYRGTTNPELTGLVDEMRRLASQGEAFANADTAFHETCWRRCPTVCSGSWRRPSGRSIRSRCPCWGSPRPSASSTRSTPIRRC